MSTPFPRIHQPRIFLFFLPLLAFFLPAANAAINESITSNLIESPAFIIDHHADDGDPNTLRNGLKTNIAIRITRSLFDPPVNAQYRISYQLIDQDGNLIKLANPASRLDAFTGISEAITVNLSGAVPGVGRTTFNTSLSVYPDPVATLISNNRYKVVASLQRKSATLPLWVDVPDTELSSNQEPVHHYTSMISGDRAWNLRATAKNLTWDRRHILQTDPETGSFKASVDVTVGRYDDWNEPMAPRQEIEVVIDYDLIEASTGNEVPLKNNGQVRHRVSLWQFSTFSSGGISQKVPNFMVINNQADLIPTGQLNSSQSHILRCTVSHNENALDEMHVDVIHELDAAGLLHFNGNLNFGTVTTQFNRLAADPFYGSTGTDPNGDNYVFSIIRIANDHGILPGTTDYAFGNEANLIVSLMDNGNSIIVVGEEEVYDPDAPGDPVIQETNNLTYTFGAVVMNNTGIITDSITVDLPQGHIYLPDTSTESHHGESSFTYNGAITLNG
ncbi:MAG: hypothetical protein VYB61_10315, partial [Verrucomicrobiota bacterium]|nr:hypothetical protein [Verrucomicrobiota bacterium]